MTDINKKKDTQFKKQELIKALQILHKETGKKPRTIDLQNDKGRPAYRTYIKYFGTWENALKEAGVNENE